jgi:poly(A) polymerase
MALSRERIADELLKLLALEDPPATVALMLEHGIFAPVLPEVGAAGVAQLARLPAREAAAGAAPDGVRRLGGLLAADPEIAAAVAGRLRLSNAARQRLVCIAQRGNEAMADPATLAYRLGLPCAIDRLLLNEALSEADAAAAVRRLDGWQKPKLPVAGGMLIARGLEAGPVVAKTLQAIEADWIEAGFPDGNAFEAIVSGRVAQALRASQ